jgi:hypothetical protein
MGFIYMTFEFMIKGIREAVFFSSFIKNIYLEEKTIDKNNIF